MRVMVMRRSPDKVSADQREGRRPAAGVSAALLAGAGVGPQEADDRFRVLRPPGLADLGLSDSQVETMLV